jgi:hypothetical protein
VKKKGKLKRIVYIIIGNKDLERKNEKEKNERTTIAYKKKFDEVIVIGTSSSRCYCHGCR